MNIFNEYWDEYDRWYEENPVLYQKELGVILETLEDIKYSIPKDSLEIGVGTGRFMKGLNFSTGIDVGKNLVENAKRQGLNVLEGRAEEIPFLDESFSCVGIFTALEFFDNIEQAFFEIKRVLKKDGYLLLSYLNKNSIEVQNIEKNKEKDKWFAQARFYQTEELKLLLNSHSFEIVGAKQLVFNHFEPCIVNGNTDGMYCVLVAKNRKDNT